eukprot:365492-Chlamydomonas_euryale.AAC.15
MHTSHPIACTGHWHICISASWSSRGAAAPARGAQAHMPHAPCLKPHPVSSANAGRRLVTLTLQAPLQSARTPTCLSAQVGGTFDGRPVSGWRGEASESRAVFVAENECIGCKQCTQIAGNTFFLEEEHGRARVRNQWADEEDVIDEV